MYHVKKIGMIDFDYLISGKILPPPEAYTKTSKHRRRQRGSGKDRKYRRNNDN